MNPNIIDPNESPTIKGVEAAIRDLAEDRPAYLNEGERDSPYKRWSGFAAIIIITSLAFGVGLALEDYYLEMSGEHFYTRAAARDRIKHETIDSLKFRFYIGAGIGAFLGVAYSAKCLIKDIDP